MDPITTITAAIAAGALASTGEVAAQAVKDGYKAFKAILLKKFGDKEDVAGALKSVEKKPESRGRQSTLKEELAAADVGQDAEIVRQAKAFLDLLKEQGLASKPSYQAILVGSGAIVQGEGAVGAGAGGFAIGGDVEGGIYVGGQKPDESKKE
jgi:hypothetical protein